MKKLTAFLLTVAMLFTLLLPAQAEEIASTAPADDTAASSVVLPISEKVELKAEDGADSYQWQIRVTDDLWVNISGANSSTLQLSYSMVANVLDDGAAMVRCQSTTGDAVNYSEETSVTVDYDAVPEFTPAEQPDPSTLVVSEAQVVDNGTSDEEPAAESEAAAPTAEPEELAPATSENALTEEQVSLFSVAPSKARRMTTNFAAGDPGSDADSGAGSDPDSTPTEEEEPLKTVTVEVQYVYSSSGDKAAESVVATIPFGSDLHTTVYSPEIIGYTPDQSEVTIDQDNIQEDILKIVRYDPAPVKVTVEYYQQNLDNDEYTLADSETFLELTGNPVGEIQGYEDKYDGFYALLYDKTTPVAADGSTVVEIYYDRYYYLMTFDLDGGYGVEPIYARYGAPISVDDPTKPGYIFGGWTPQLPTTMPAYSEEDLSTGKNTYRAQWTAVDQAKVTVVFWGENADDEDYAYLGSYETVATPNTRFEFNIDDLSGSAADQILICGKEAHTHTDACIKCTHTHTLECYSAGRNYVLTETSAPTDPGLEEQENNIWTYTSGHFGLITHYYLHLGDKWYCAQGSRGKADTQNISLDCNHKHDASCLICGKEEHRHTDSCYLSSVFDPNLWELNIEKTEAIDSVEADGSSVLNVYFDRKEFTLTFQEYKNAGWNSGWRTVATITAKWDAEISQEFNKDPFNTTYDGRAWQCTDTSKYSYALQTLDRMPQFDATFHLYNKSSDTLKTIHYYVENVGANVNENQWPSDPGNNFTLLKTVETYFNYATYEEEYHEIDGFTRYSASRAGFSNGQKNFTRNNMNLYYLRNDYPLVFNNGYENVKQEQVQYEAPLSTYSDFIPEMPTELYEEGSCEFAGWYLNPECSGDEYKLDEHTMPLDGLILYAKWVPVTHTVKFYQDETKTTPIGNTLTVSHGTMIPEEQCPEDPQNGKYVFVGWFYQDEDGKEQAFDPANMPVNHDLDLYAKWSSDVLMEYTIHYVYRDQDGQDIKIADDTTGSALAGTTKTFDAKGGTQLYEAYQEGYFPQTKSHSLTINIDDESQNEYTFVYTSREAVAYTVLYLDAETKQPLAEQKYESSKSAIVTEAYEPISGYMPDEFQKSLVLEPGENEQDEWNKNQIVFLYHEDTVHAPVRVEHYIQNVEGSGYTLAESEDIRNGEIDHPISVTSLNKEGFTFNESKTEVLSGNTKQDFTVKDGEVTATITKEGLLLKLYYDRKEYPYEFRFLEQNTNQVLLEPKGGKAVYEKLVSQRTLSIDGYTCITYPNTQVIKIAVEAGDVAEKNVKTFYYTENNVTINYQAVGPDGVENFGRVSSATETVKVFTGPVQGSTATAGEGYRFVGWYKDAACSIPVESGWVDENDRLTPQKTENAYGDKAGFVEATYYAKFEPDVAPLTITKTAAAGTTIDPNQVFLFHITGPDDFSMDVVIHGEGSVTIDGLQVDKEYTVTEDTTWSWRYTPTTDTPQPITLMAGGSKVIFTNELTNPHWVDSTTSAENQWQANGTVTSANN